MLNKVRQWRLVRLLVRRVGVHRVTTVIGFLQAPFLAVLGLVLKRLPRNSRLVVLGSPLDRFADNAAYLYLHLSEHVPRIHAVWISGSADVVRHLRSCGYRAETRWSWGGCRATLRAGTFVYSGYRSDINRWLSPGATAVALWHGLPIKRVERAVGTDQTRRTLLGSITAMAREAPPDFLLAPSEFVTRCFSPAFGVPRERCWQLGYPRADHLLAAPENPPAALVWHEREWRQLRSAPRVVGLFLTWRDDRVDDAADSALVQRLVKVCSSHGGVLAYKAHYNVAPVEVPSTGCVQIPADADLHAYLGLCDVLVTDYSSVALDFLLMHRPVVYFMPDLEHYDASRGLQIDPQDLPGVVTRDQESLLASVEYALAHPDGFPWRAEHDRFLRQMWGGYTGQASQSIAAALLQLDRRRTPAAGDGQ
jgi:CDP-glycerol glycerophosphotransferase (TagB/SpsB family)